MSMIALLVVSESILQFLVTGARIAAWATWYGRAEGAARPADRGERGGRGTGTARLSRRGALGKCCGADEASVMGPVLGGDRTWG